METRVLQAMETTGSSAHGSGFRITLSLQYKAGRSYGPDYELQGVPRRAKEGEDYEDAFAPVPHATSGRIVISLAAANNLELHSCD
eukprot:2475013-Rhodomonas_salina.1